MTADSEQGPLLRTVEAIQRGNNERRKDAQEDTEEEIGKRAIVLMIYSAVESAS